MSHDTRSDSFSKLFEEFTVHPIPEKQRNAIFLAADRLLFTLGRPEQDEAEIQLDDALRDARILDDEEAITDIWTDDPDFQILEILTDFGMVVTIDPQKRTISARLSGTSPAANDE